MRISDQEASRLRVLRAIRRAEPASRTELAALTGLPSQAISDVVADLLRRNLLHEEKAAALGRGRPRIRLRINGDAARVIGAFLFPNRRLGVDIANLRGERLFARSFELPASGSVSALAALIAERVDSTVAESPFPRGTIDSLGLGVPAVVDSPGGVLHWMPGYPPGPAPLAAMLSDRLQLPVFLDSAADVLTRAEHWYGEDRQVDDFALIFVGLGIGLGQYVDGCLRTGDHGTSPAFAHLKMTAGSGPACLCGARGCLTTYASVSGVVGRICERRGRAAPALEQLEATLHAFAREARAGEADAGEAFEFAGTALGVAAANYINLWDPARLVVLVQDHTFAEMISAPFRAALGANTLPALRGRAPVQFRASEEVAFSKGAAAVVLERLYRGSRDPSGRLGRARAS